MEGKRKFKRMGLRHSAVESYLVRHRGRAIRIYQMPIPGFYGAISQEILEMAAAKAYKNGWRKIVLTWGDMLSSCCFDDGYAWLLAMNISMASRSDSTYRDDQYLCDIGRDGEVFKPQDKSLSDDERHSILNDEFEFA